MTKLMPTLIFAFILAFISEGLSLKEYDTYGNKKYVKKEKVFYIIMALGLAVFAGLRTKYNDTSTYINSYEICTSNLSSIYHINWLEIGDNPGYNAIMIILKHIRFSTQSYLMFYALITNLIYFWFIRKYSENTLLSLFLFITMGTYSFSMAAVKQSFAVAICLVAVDRCIQKKYFSFLFWIVIATLFHPYSLMFLITPILDFKPWSEKTFVLLIIFAMLGLGLKSLLGTIISVTTMFGEDYSVKSFSGEGVNVFRLAVVWSPILLSFVTRGYFQENQSRERNVIFALSMLNAEIMFIALFGTANYFARLANYFLIFQYLSLPISIKGFNKNSQPVITCLVIFCFCAYFYYSMNVVYGSFDARFSSVSLIEYLKSLV